MTLDAFLHHLAFCAVLAALSAVAVRSMIFLRVMDTPSARKMHDRPIPKGGGVGIVLAFLLGIAVLYQVAEFSRLADPYFRGVILAAAAIAVVAFLDDVRDWPFIGSGLYVHDIRVPYVGAVSIGWFGAVATFAWILFATNAMNFIDGLNGLAGGVALVACLFLAYISAMQAGWFVYFAALLLAAGLVGFLPFNFPRARIFMGDVGSQFCGFMLAVLGVAASRFGAVEMPFVLVPLLLFGVLFDVAFTLVRRLLAGQNVTHAHRGHLYQFAQRGGIDPRAVAVVHWGFAGFGGLTCLLFLAAPSNLKPILLLLPLLPQLIWLGLIRNLVVRNRFEDW